MNKLHFIIFVWKYYLTTFYCLFFFYNFVESLLNVFALQLILPLIIYSFMKLFYPPSTQWVVLVSFCFYECMLWTIWAVIVNFANKFINFCLLNGSFFAYFWLESFLLEHVHFFPFCFVLWEIQFNFSPCYHILILVTAV